MPLTTIVPISDILTTNWSEHGPGTAFYEQVNEGIGSYDDNTTEIGTSVDSATIKMGLSALPGNFSFANTVTYSFRAYATSGKATRYIKFRIYGSSGTSAITSETTISLATQDYTTFSSTMAITGTNSASSWTNSQIHIYWDSGGTGGGRISTIDFSIDYTATSSGGAVSDYYYKNLVGRM